MHQLQRSWVRSQHPSAQWNLRGGRWSSVEYSTKKNPPKNIKKKKFFKISCHETSGPDSDPQHQPFLYSHVPSGAVYPYAFGPPRSAQRCGTVTIFYGSGSNFLKVMVPFPVPVPTFEKLWFRFRFLLLKSYGSGSGSISSSISRP